MNKRSDEIYAKGFNMLNYSSQHNAPIEYKKVKVGVKTLDDAVLTLGDLQKNKLHPYCNKGSILQALMTRDIAELRNISNYFYDMSGIYKRICEYFAFLYRFDWYVAPEIYDDSVNEEKIKKDFMRILNYLDNSYIRKICGDIALEVIKNGCYYAYIVPSPTGLVLQQLPVGYCRSRYMVKNMPAVEFNMKFFDTFADPAYRMKVLKLFPDEFAKGYLLYKQGKLKPDNKMDSDYYYDGESSWYLLDPQSTLKFNFNGSDIPIFANAIPSILDLDAAQDLDRRKQMQKLLKIVVQKLPIDKNGDLIFDVDEARDIHNNAVEMLRRAIGVDVLTTFTDVDSIDMSDKNTSTTVDDLEKIERSVYNAFGTSRNIFNTDGNLALDKSILNDESTVRNLLLQFSMFFDRVTQSLNTQKKKYNFKFNMLETTQYNYKELSKLYKEQTQMGYSKMLPQIALGHSQSFILNSVKFENDILHLSEVMIPPLMSSTLNGQDILGGKTGGSSSSSGTNKSAGTSSDKGGRPEKADDQKSEKTIKNKESMG